MVEFQYFSHSPEETHKLGQALGKLCLGGEKFLLFGELGSGKTCLLQGLARGLEVAPEQPVVSPTFVLHCQYQGRIEFNHLDLYRLQEAPDLFELGFAELFYDQQSVCAVEWAEILGAQLPLSYLEVSVYSKGACEREFRLNPVADEELVYKNMLSRLSVLLQP